MDMKNITLRFARSNSHPPIKMDTAQIDDVLLQPKLWQYACAIWSINTRDASGFAVDFNKVDMGSCFSMALR